MPSFISSLFSKGNEEQEKDTSADPNVPAAGVEEGDVKWSAIKTAVEKVESKTRIEPAHPVKESDEAKDKMPSATSTTTEKNQSAPLGDCSADHFEETIPGKAPSPVELGNSGWNILHSAAAVFPYKPSKEEKKGMEQLLYGFSYSYACSWCAYHMRLYLKDNPPEVEHKHMITQYICRFHNNVNEHLKKPLINCDNTEELLRRWHPGYPDRMQDKPSWEVRMAEAQKKLLPTALGHGSRAQAPEKAKPTEAGVTAPAAASSTGGARAPTTTAVSEKNCIDERKTHAPPPSARTVDPNVHTDDAALSAVLEKGGFTPDEALLQANEKVTHAGRIAECSAFGLQEENHPPIDGSPSRFSSASFPPPSVVADNISRHICETFVAPDKVKVGDTLSAWWQDVRFASRFGSGNAPAEDGIGGSERVPSPRSWNFSTPWSNPGRGEAAPDSPTTTPHPLASWLPTFGIPSLFSSKEGASNSRGGSDALSISRDGKPSTGILDGGDREHKIEAVMGDDGAIGGTVHHPIRPTVSPAEYSVPGFIAACFPPLVPPTNPVPEEGSHPIGDTRSATTADHVSRPRDDPAAPAFASVVPSASSLPSRGETSWWRRWWPGSGSSGPTGMDDGRMEGNTPLVSLAPPLVPTVTTPVSSAVSVPHAVPMAATKATPVTVSVKEKPTTKEEEKTKRSEVEPRGTTSPSASSSVASPLRTGFSQDSENARSLGLETKRNDLPVLSLESMQNELSALLLTVKRASPEVEEMIQMLTHSAKEGTIKVTEKAQKAMEHILQMKNDPNFPASIQGMVTDQLEVLKTTVKDLDYSQHAEALEAFLATIRNEVKHYVSSKEFGLSTLRNEKNAKGVVSSFPTTAERTTFKGSDGGTSIPPPAPNRVSTTERVADDTKGIATAALSQVVHSKGMAGPTTLTSHENESKKEKVNMMELMKSMNDCDIYCPEDDALLGVKPLRKEHGK